MDPEGVVHHGLCRNLSRDHDGSDGNFSRGIKCAILEKRSTTVEIVVLPLEGCSPITKSNEMWDHGCWGAGSGCSRPICACVEVLFQAQTGQAATYSNTSFSIAGHQNRCFITNMIHEHDSRMACKHGSVSPVYNLGA